MSGSTFDSPGFARTVELVRAARAGDRGARDLVIERYLPRVSEMVALRLGRRLASLVEIEDLVQESMLRALRAIDDFRELTEGTFRAYMSRIVANCVHDAARHYGAKKRGEGAPLRFADLATGALPLEAADATQPTPSRVLLQKELTEEVEAAVLRLKPRHREVIGLRYVLGLTFAEIRAAMQLNSDATARSLDLRARAELAALLGADPFGGGAADRGDAREAACDEARDEARDDARGDAREGQA